MTSQGRQLHANTVGKVTTTLKCRLKNVVCHSCNTKGHIMTVCRKKQNIHMPEEQKDDSVLIVNSFKQDSKKKKSDYITLD